MRYRLSLCWFLLLMGCGSSDGELEEKYLLANAYLTEGRYTEARPLYDEVIEARPEFIGALNNRGIVHHQLGTHQQALEDFDQVLQLYPDNYDAWFNRSGTLWAMGRWRTALEELDELSQQEDKAQIFFRRGLIQAEQGLMTEALASFGASLQRDPSDIESAVNMANTAFYLNKLSQADSILETVLLRDPEQHQALNTQSLIALEEGDVALALNLQQKVLELTPNDAYYLNNLGRIMLEMDSLQHSEQLVNESMLLDPDNPWVYRNKAHLYLKMGDIKQALVMLEQAQNLPKSYPIKDLNFLLGWAFQLDGRTSEACEWWRKGRDMGDQKSLQKWEEYCY